eukprot:PITA_21453
MELHVPRLPSISVHHVFLVLTACCASIFPCLLCLDRQYQYCQNTSKCGSMDIKYPFGVGNRGCGHPKFQINCVQNSSPVIEIHDQSYTILRFYIQKNFFIARGKNCNFFYHRSNYPQIPLSENGDDRFKILGKENRTLGVYRCNMSFQNALDYTGEQQLWKCNATVYYDFYSSGRSMIPGCSIEQVDVEVGETQYVSTDTQRNNSCNSCEATGGICGYNNLDSTNLPFLCYCKDGPHTHKCSGHGMFYFNLLQNYLELEVQLRCKDTGSSVKKVNKLIAVHICESGKKATNGVTIDVSVGAAVLLSAGGLLVGITLYAKRRRKAASRCSKVEEFLKEYADQMPTRYSLSQMKKITNNFAEKLGEGGFGVVYKGKLRNGTLVAVKLLDRHRQGESTDFMNEVATIGRLHHVNLVRLLGYCFESFTSALVYEFMANGSLEKFIFAGKEKGRLLTWENLYSIALGTARGIAYLHQDCEKRIIHFDIKPHNILLDADFTPKVSDFGLAKLCRKGDDHISMTAMRGTPGYVAPEVFDRALGPATDKSDVYSFGMLLLEIVGERKNFDSKVSHSSQFYFPEWAFKLLERGELGMRLRGGEVEAEDEEKARRMTKVGLWCIQYNYNDRPSMSSVVQMLQENGGEVANPPLPSSRQSSFALEKPLLSSAEESSSIEIRS